MKKMKKLFALIMIAVLSLGLVPVNAEGEVKVNKIEKKWDVDYKVPGYDLISEDLAATEDGFYEVGYFYQAEPIVVDGETDGDVGGLDVLESDEDAGYIIKYDNNGNVVWEKVYRDEYIYFTGVASVSDGAIVLVEDYKNKDIVLFKYSEKGELVSKKVILEEYEIDNYEYLSMESYNDIVVVSFDNYLFVYNNLTGEVKTKTYNPEVDDASNAVVASDINENGVYVGYYDYSTTSAVLVKYNYDLTGEVVSEVKALNSIVTALSVVNGNVVVGVTDTDDVGKIVVLDKDLKLVKETAFEGKTYFYDFAETRDGFAAVMVNDIEEYTEPLEPVEPTDPQASLNVRRENDLKAIAKVEFYGIKFFDNELNEYLPEIETAYYVERIEKVVGGLVYFDIPINEDDELYITTTKLGYEEYAYDVKADENGEVAVTKTEDGKWQVVVTPKEGYQVSKVIVTNSEGSVEYTTATFETDMDDVTIEVVYEKIPVNPNTGLSNPYVICGIVLVVGVAGYSFLKKKKYI